MIVVLDDNELSPTSRGNHVKAPEASLACVRINNTICVQMYKITIGERRKQV